MPVAALGGPAIAIASHIDVEIVGVTVSHRQVEIARGLVNEAGLSDRVTVMFADYESLPFTAASFDQVVFFESTGYSIDKAQLMAEAYRVVRPGGRVYVKDVVVKDDDLTPAERDDQTTSTALRTKCGPCTRRRHWPISPLRCKQLASSTWTATNSTTSPTTASWDHR